MCYLYIMFYKNIYKDQKCFENIGDIFLLYLEDFIERCMFYKRLCYFCILFYFICNGVLIFNWILLYN